MVEGTDTSKVIEVMVVTRDDMVHFSGLVGTTRNLTSLMVPKNQWSYLGKPIRRKIISPTGTNPRLI